jgi:hypothetical protein
MSVPAQQTTFTPEDLLHLPDGGLFELVNGQPVEKNKGFESSFVGLQLSFLLVRYCYSKGLGWVLPADASYQCFADDPAKVRKPDVSFIQANRLSASERPNGTLQDRTRFGGRSSFAKRLVRRYLAEGRRVPRGRRTFGLGDRPEGRTRLCLPPKRQRHHSHQQGIARRRGRRSRFPLPRRRLVQAAQRSSERLTLTRVADNQVTIIDGA